MAEKTQRVDKNLMASPYYFGYSQSRQGGQPARRPNMTTVGHSHAPMRSGETTQRGQIYGRPIYAEHGAATAYTKQLKHKPKEYDAFAKQKRKERGYFFVMRPGICFLIFLFSLVMVATVALSFLKIMPQYTSFFIEPDITLAEARGDEYIDQSKYITIDDSIYGFIDKITGKEELQHSYNANVEALKAQADANPALGGTIGIFTLVYEYHPIAIALLAIFALVVMILSFAGMFNRRIFKGFGALAIVMFILAVVVNFAGITMLFSKAGMFAPEQVELDFTAIIKFYSMLQAGGPADVAAAVHYIMGFGVIIVVACPIVILFWSIFARRKIPYSVFDKM